MRTKINAALIQLSIVGLCAFSMLVVVLSFSSTPTAATSELLINPDFEDGLTGWGKSPGTTVFNVITTPVYSGLQGAAVGSASNSTKAIVQAVSGIVAGQVYTLTGYGHVEDTNVNVARLRLAWYPTIDCSGKQSSSVDSNELTAITSGFTLLTIGPVTAPAGTQCAEVRVQVAPKNAAPATAYFDTISFTTTPILSPTPTLTAATATPTSTITSTLPPPPTLTPTPVISPSPSLTTGLIINEVAWSGTAASGNDEWFELYNITSQDIPLAGWSVTNLNGGININLTGVISANSYYLLERTDDTTVVDIPADLIYSGGLVNTGDTLFLRSGSVVVDSVNMDGGSWPAGTSDTNRASMERIDPTGPDLDINWASNDLTHRNGLDANNEPINGTPGQSNSTVYTPPPPPPPPPPPFGLTISEVAWGGTTASGNDEWLELHNPTTATLVITGTLLTSTNGLNIVLFGTIPPGGYFLLERTDDTTVSDLEADQIYTGGLTNTGDALFLSFNGLVLDTANLNGGAWPAGNSSPDFASMERIDPFAPDIPDNWLTNDLRHRNGLDANSNPINGTPGQANSSTFPLPPVISLLISELLYEGLTPSTEGDEFVEVCNPTDQPADLTGYKVGDEEEAGKGEGMYRFPEGLILPATDCLIIAKNAAAFVARFGALPDFEVVVTGDGYTDTPAVPNLSRYTGWGSGSWALTNHSDEFLVIGPDDQIIDAVAYRNGLYEALALRPSAQAPAPYSLQRVWPFDRDWMAADFFYDQPTPGMTTPLPSTSGFTAGIPITPDMSAFFGVFHGQTTFAGGSAPPDYLLAKARAAGFHFLGLTDPGEALTPDAWMFTTDSSAALTSAGQFIAFPGSTWQQEDVGFVNLFGLPEPVHAALPEATSLADLYQYLSSQPAAIAQFDSPKPGDFEDFRFQAAAAPRFYVVDIAGDEIRSPASLDLTALQRSWSQGWRVAPGLNPMVQAPEWASTTSARTGLIAPTLTADDLLTALRDRRIFATTDANFALAFKANDVWQGSELAQAGLVNFEVFAVDTEAEEATLIVYDRTMPLLQTTQPTDSPWQFQIETLPGHFYWIEARQSDGDVALTAPIWIAGEMPPETIYLNELLPDPDDIDWDGDGTVDSTDEWIELFNPGEHAIGLGGWSVKDASGKSYLLPTEAIVPRHGYYVIFKAVSGISLNNSRDSLTLSRPDGSIADAADYQKNPGNDVTFCRLPDGGPWSLTCQPTPSSQNEALPEAEPLELSIYDAKRVTDGAWVRVRGYVTVPPGVFGKNVMYIQDSTHGIRVKLPSKHHYWFAEGDRLEITGYLDLYENEWEIDIRGVKSKIKNLHENKLVTPLAVNSGMMKEGYEGLLVQMEVSLRQFVGRHFWVDDGTGAAYAYLFSGTKIRRAGLKPGMSITIVGIASHRTRNSPPREGYRILPRYQHDIIQHAAASVGASNVISGLIISEVAWAGTAASSNDEWLELYNTTNIRLTLDSLLITSTHGLRIPLKGVIEPQSFFLLERTDDSTVADVTADQIYTGRLGNDGDSLFLSNGPLLLDSINADGGPWPAGSASPHYRSMERRFWQNLADNSSWGSNDAVHRHGRDAEGHPINGTPKSGQLDLGGGLNPVLDWPALLPQTGH